MNNFEDNYRYFHAKQSEASHAHGPAQMKKVKRSFRILALSVLTVMTFTMFSVYGVRHETRQEIELSETSRENLVNELGKVTQENFVLSQRVESQEAVLQSIESNFSELGRGLKQLEGGDALFADIFGELEVAKQDAPSFLLPENVDLASVKEDGTFDILILGNNGAHTDTIMVASINEDKKKMTLFSIPRDLYVNGRRINQYYTYYGVDQLNRMIEIVTGLKMDRYVQVDLQAFVNLVDLLGGVDLYVSETIQDGLYPNGKGGYEAYSIQPGQYHMDGATALKYARSRKSTSDFDRAARQQKIMTALRAKVQGLDAKLSLKQLSELFATGLQYAETDITLLELVSYYYDYRSYDLRSGLVLSNSNYLHSLINESGAYTLLPRTGNFEEIQKVIAEQVN